MWLPMVTGRKRNMFLKTETGIMVSAEYLRMKDCTMVFVVMISMVFECMIFWKSPESWSAWQCVRMHLSIRVGGMPNSAR